MLLYTIVETSLFTLKCKRAGWPLGSADTVCPRPPLTLEVDRLTLKLVCESHLRCGTFLPNFGTLGLWVLELFTMYAMTDRQTDGRTKATLIAPFPGVGGIIDEPRIIAYDERRTSFALKRNTTCLEVDRLHGGGRTSSTIEVSDATMMMMMQSGIGRRCGCAVAAASSNDSQRRSCHHLKVCSSSCAPCCETSTNTSATVSSVLFSTTFL